MDVNKNNWLYVFSAICVICWTCLAIVFNKWWLALFAFLFTPVRLYTRFCDKCGKRSIPAFTYNRAIENAKAAGWVIRKVGDKWDDRCPDCQQEE